MNTLLKMWDPGYGDVARTKNLELLKNRVVLATAEDTVIQQDQLH